jgi:peptidyl-prolyl cis-trans isomerase D
MAIIGKIREKSILMLVIIGVAMVAFVLGDFLRGGGTVEQKRTSYGTIYGQPVNGTTYESRVRESLDQTRDELALQGRNLEDSIADAIRNSEWERLVRETIMNREMNAVGLTVHKDELQDVMLGDNIHPAFSESELFKDSINGQFIFSKQRLIDWFQTTVKGGQNPRAEVYWHNMEKFITKSRREMKYHNMISKGLYVTSREAERDYVANNEKVDVRFVVKKYADISDSSVNITEADIKKYYDKHKNERIYEQIGSRSFEYVEFKMELSETDKKQALDKAKKLVSGFQTSKNDSLFVVRKSTAGFYNPNAYNYLDYNDEINQAIADADSTDPVVGPFLHEDYWKVFKVIDKREAKQANARHILITYDGATRADTAIKRNKVQAKALADSLYSVLTANPAQFDTLAKTMSDGPSGANGGSLGWFNPGQMVEDFNNFVFDSPVDSLSAPLETEFGYHVIHIQDKRNYQYNLGAVDVKIKPLRETRDQARLKAIEFAGANTNTKKFSNASTENGYSIRLIERVTIDQKQVGTFGEAKDLKRWLFTANKGNVSSDPFVYEDRVIVAHLTEIKKEGTPKLDDVRTQMEVKVRTQKKAELFMEKMSGFNSLEELSVGINERILDQKDLTFAQSTMIGGGGNEPSVVGTIFTLNAGDLSLPIKGTAGVYVVLVETVKESPAKEGGYTAEKASMTESLRSRASWRFNNIYQALREKANVKDNRSKNEILGSN